MILYYIILPRFTILNTRRTSCCVLQTEAILTQSLMLGFLEDASGCYSGYFGVLLIIISSYLDAILIIIHIIGKESPYY
jgi:hypothetical protein